MSTNLQEPLMSDAVTVASSSQEALVSDFLAKQAKKLEKIEGEKALDPSVQDSLKSEFTEASNLKPE